MLAWRAYDAAQRWRWAKLSVSRWQFAHVAPDRAPAIIATGTPAGAGIGFDPPKFLKAGEIVKMQITGLGALTNRFA